MIESRFLIGLCDQHQRIESGVEHLDDVLRSQQFVRGLDLNNIQTPCGKILVDSGEMFEVA